MKAVIHEATLVDAAALEAAYPSDGWFVERIRASGSVACVIVAFVDGLPVAHLDLRSEPYHAVIRDALSACHEVNAMLVHDAAHRSRVVGTAKAFSVSDWDNAPDSVAAEQAAPA